MGRGHARGKHLGETTTVRDSRVSVHDAVNGWDPAGVPLVCLLCAAAAPPGDLFWGCRSCGVAAPLALAVPPPSSGSLGITAAMVEARRAAPLMAASASTPSLRVTTPLTAAPNFGAGVFLKHETFSLTGSHKDRFHAVASRMAVALGSRGIVASSTGNHGVSAAAFAALVGLPAVVFCHPSAPAGLLRAIGAYGGIAAQLDPAAQREELLRLVRDGWFPATSMDPALSGAANPFGAEGYKAIAHETVEQLGRMPHAVFVPTAGGDTLYGVMKGYAELAALTGTAPPTVFAVQPEGANALGQSLAAGRQMTVANPRSIALSLADPQTGRHAMVALDRWAGQALDVTEAAIQSAIVDLAGAGMYLDPASAAALAGYRLAIANGALTPDSTAVLLLTSSGFKWPDAMAEVFPATAASDSGALHRLLADRTDAIVRA